MPTAIEETGQAIPVAEVPFSQILSSPLYDVAPMAQWDGLHATYTLQGPEGKEIVVGTQGLLVRISEK